VLGAGAALITPLGGCAAEPETNGAVCKRADDVSHETLQEARASVPDCVVPGEPGAIYESRCGELHAISVGGIDSEETRYYDGAGKLVGEKDWSLVARVAGCRSFDPSFTAPPEHCERVTPQCATVRPSL